MILPKFRHPNIGVAPRRVPTVILPVEGESVLKTAKADKENADRLLRAPDQLPADLLAQRLLLRAVVLDGVHLLVLPHDLHARAQARDRVAARERQELEPRVVSVVVLLRLEPRLRHDLVLVRGLFEDPDVVGETQVCDLEERVRFPEVLSDQFLRGNRK